MPLNHALILMPNPHVSLSTSNIQKAHHPITPIIIKEARFSKCDSLRSVMAIAIKISSKSSFGTDIGIGRYPSLSRNIKKKFKINRTQNVSILYEYARYMNRIIKGSMVTIAIPVIPEFMNEYILSKNRRKSSNTLPPFSPAYWDSLL